MEGHGTPATFVEWLLRKKSMAKWEVWLLRHEHTCMRRLTGWQSAAHRAWEVALVQHIGPRMGNWRSECVGRRCGGGRPQSSPLGGFLGYGDSAATEVWASLGAARRDARPRPRRALARSSVDRRPDLTLIVSVGLSWRYYPSFHFACLIAVAAPDLAAAAAPSSLELLAVGKSISPFVRRRHRAQRRRRRPRRPALGQGYKMLA